MKLVFALATLLSAASAGAQTGSWLSPYGSGGVRYLLCSYQGSKLVSSQPFVGGRLQNADGSWTCKAVGKGPETDVTFRLESGRATSAGIAVAFDFARWSRQNYLLIPAVIYDGNRFHALGGEYMPAFPPDMFFNPNLPLTISNEPRLSVEPGVPGKIELLTGNASTPAICSYDPVDKQGFILLVEQQSKFGNNGLFVEENAHQDRASFVVSAPGVREQAAGFGGFSPSGDAGVDWKPGDSVTLRLRVYRFHADGIPALLHRFVQVRNDLIGPNHPRDLIPMSALAAAAGNRISKRWSVCPAGSFYLPENSPDFQLGWVSGFMQTPLLALDEWVERERMCRQADFVVNRLQGKSGYFYAGITAAGRLRADRQYQGRLLVLTRKNADTLESFIKQFLILKEQGHADRIRPEWEQAALRLAQAFQNTWKKHGQFGQYLDPDTGEIAVYNSTGGAIVPGALAMASRYFHDTALLKVAIESADYYFRRDVVALGLTGGHCGDITQDPDSESAFGFLDSLMALYWATGERSWLSKAVTEADLAATWTLSYDETFPASSQIGKLGGHMAGAVFASAQNKHAAPGICTSSGDYLFKLFRATGEDRFAELIRNIQHAQVEATDFPGHPICGEGFGASMERIQPTDAEGKGQIGQFYHTENAWTVLDGLLMDTELPGIYVQTDSHRIFTFDHVSAKADWLRDGSVKLTIVNRTAFDGSVSLFAETSEHARRPLAYVAYLGWPHVSVRAGESKTVLLDARGRVVR